MSATAGVIRSDASDVGLGMVGVVAIGRNEGERLRACLTSALAQSATVVYVDSGSTDGSAALAASLGVHVVALDLSRPFTAARARNEGAARLLQVAPSTAFIQFVDGDCEIAPGWIATARQRLQSDPTLAIVCGRRRERFPDASVYNRLCDMEWNTPVGRANACGGDMLIRADAFAQVNGYDPAVIAGEEPEMCVRLRARGWQIQRIDAEMTLHDAAMTHLWQWWKRNVRAGYAYAQGNALHGGPPESFRQRELRSIRFWAMVPVLLTFACVIALAVIRPRWCWVGLTPLGMYLMLAAKIASNRRKRGAPMADAILYAAAVVVGKFPQHWGTRLFARARRRGEQQAIIEYKGAPTTPTTNSLDAPSPSVAHDVA